jgi:translation initiation factor IF-1
MVKNITGGNKAKRGKRGGRMSKNPTTEFNTEDGLHFYAQVTSKVGGNTIEVLLQTGETVHANIPGRFKKRVWFNKDDLIIVRQESGKFYDVLQKIINPSTMIAASTALNIKIDKDNSNIFRADIVDEESDDEDSKPIDSKTSLMMERRKKDKDRDIKRRGEENDEFDRVISVVTKEDLKLSDSDKSDSTKSVDSLGNKIEKKPTQTIAATAVESSDSESNETDGDSETDSTDSSESEEEDFTPTIVPAKKTVSSQSFLKATSKTSKTPKTPKTPQGKPTKLVEPNAPERPVQAKRVIYKETPEEVARMLGL